jgi:hypothetical protein
MGRRKMTTYKVTRVSKFEYTESRYALFLLEEIENRINELDKLPKEAFAEWDSVFEEVAIKFSNLNLKVSK